MSKRIDRRFEKLGRNGKKALIPFMTAGDPSPDWTVALMHRLVEEGADLIELGVPFSDPTADGPVIQAASERAIRSGVNLAGVLAMVREFRAADDQTPVVLMGYLNPVERFGYARFCESAAESGVDGLLMVDCPPEEMGPLRRCMDEAGIQPICLFAPTTTAQRRRMICEFAAGFVYYVSFKGITGADRLDVESIIAPVAALREATQLPVVVGFGVKDAETAAAVAACADGVVIGSTLVALLADAEGKDDALDRAGRFVAPVRRAMDNTTPDLSN